MHFRLLPLIALLAASPASAAPTELRCAGADGAARTPRLVVKAEGGYRIFLCAVSGRKRKGHVEVRGFRVFSIGRSGKHPKKIFESEAGDRTFRAESKGTELRLSELVWDGKGKVPAFETLFQCDSAGCHSSQPECVFQGPKAGSRRALEEIAEFQHGKKQGKVPSKKLIDSLAALAYSGDLDAQKVFRDRGALALDGAASDAYFDHQALLNRLRKADCLPSSSDAG